MVVKISFLLLIFLLNSCSTYETKHLVHQGIVGEIEGLQVSDHFIGDRYAEASFEITATNTSSKPIIMKRNSFSLNQQPPIDTDREIQEINNEINHKQDLISISETTNLIQNIITLPLLFSKKGNEQLEQLERDEREIEYHKYELNEIYKKRDLISSEFLPNQLTILPGQTITKKIKFNILNFSASEIKLVFLKRVSSYKLL